LSIKLCARLIVGAFLACLVSFPQAAQSDSSANPDSSTKNQSPAVGREQPAPAPSPQTQKNPIPDKGQTTGQASSATSNDRLFFALPNFLTLENAHEVPPLTIKQKFGVVTRGSFDYVQYPWYGFLSGIGQAQDSEPGYGQGAEGYAKRFGAAFADGTIENYMTGAVLPSLLRQDPRYFQSGQGSFWHRTGYAMSRNLITRTDAGGEQFNYSEVVGGALAAAISTYSYHPKSHLFTTTTPGVLRYTSSDRTLPNTGKVWGTQYGYDTLTLVVKEFWPDIRRKIRHTPKPDVSPADPKG
jgi:hypothetical protein